MFKNVLQKKFLWEIDVTVQKSRNRQWLGFTCAVVHRLQLVKMKQNEHMKNCQDLSEKRSDSIRVVSKCYQELLNFTHYAWNDHLSQCDVPSVSVLLESWQSVRQLQDENHMLKCDSSHQLNALQRSIETSHDTTEQLHRALHDTSCDHEQLCSQIAGLNQQTSTSSVSRSA
jgi:hypothetical protein